MTKQDVKWPTSGRGGKSTWIAEKGVYFTKVEAPDGTLRSIGIGHDDIDDVGYRTCACQQMPSCPRRFPEIFEYCPECGNRLESPIDLTNSVTDTPNFGAGRNKELPAFELASSERRVMPLPGGKLFAFACPTEAQGLFALARDEAGLFRWSHSAEKWIPLLVLSSARHFINDAWTMAVTPDAMVFATDEGIETLVLEAGASSVRREQGPAHCKSLSGAARFGDRIFVPVLHRSEGLGVVSRPYPVAEGDWRFDAVAPSVEDTGAFGRPIRSSRGLFWCAAQGHLTILMDAPNQPRWRSWNPNFDALVGHAPLLTKNQIAYQFGHIGSSYGFERLTDKLVNADQHRVAGAMLLAGTMACRNDLRLLSEPWREESPANRQVNIGRDQFLYPVAEFNTDQSVVVVTEGRLQLSKLASDQLDRELRGQVAFCHRVEQIEELGMIVHIRTTGQLQAFRFGNHLWVYDSYENTLCRWHCRTRPGHVR